MDGNGRDSRARADTGWRRRRAVGIATAILAATALAAWPALSGGVVPAAPSVPNVSLPAIWPPAPAPVASPPTSSAARGAQAAAPAYVPPLHGTVAHGQGTVASVGTNGSTSGGGPVSGNPAGGSNEIVLGRSRGEQGSDGSYHGHITIVALFGTELLGVDSTKSGRTVTGPLAPVVSGVVDPVNQQVLQALCAGSGGQICVDVLTARSTTGATGSTNHFAVANASLGGAGGVNATVAESDGNISQDSNCQTASGHSQVAGASVGGTSVLDLAESNSQSQACRGGSPSQSSSSKVINLLGTGLPVPAAGCANGTPNTVFSSLAPILTAICNADDTNGSQASAPYNVREALTVFALQTGSSALLKATTAAAESHAVAPAAPGPSPNPSPSPGPRGHGTKPGHGHHGTEPGRGVEQVEFATETPAPSATSAENGRELPMTGTELILLVLAGAALLGAGVSLRAFALDRRVG